MSHPFLQMCGVRKAFGDHEVLRGIDLTVEPGEIFTLLGGSGSGKSVLLKHAIGLLRADRGEIFIDGEDVTGLSEREWVAVRTQIGFVFQGAALFDSLSVKDNVAYALREHRSWKEPRVAGRVAECLHAVGLSGIETKMPAELSGGMRKRVGVARAIALAPRAILYDEPTTGLDPANSRRIGQLIRTLQRELEVTSIVVTHDLDLCFEVSDRVALLQDGELVIQGTVDELRASDIGAVREFLEGVPADSASGAAGAQEFGGGVEGRVDGP